MSSERTAQIRTLLEAAFAPTELEIADDSGKHAGHSHGGAGHFAVRLCSAQFEGRSTLERHKLVYAALATMMPSEIHALSIAAFAPTER